MFTTELTKMKKQRLMQVTLWQEKLWKTANRIINSTFLTTKLKFSQKKIKRQNTLG